MLMQHLKEGIPIYPSHQRSRELRSKNGIQNKRNSSPKITISKREKDTKNPANWFTEIWIPIEQKSIESLTAN